MACSTVYLRDRRKLTLPAKVVAAIGLAIGDAIEVHVVEGGILLMPKPSTPNSGVSMSRFAGVGRGVFGHTAAEADNLVRDLRGDSQSPQEGAAT